MILPLGERRYIFFQLIFIRRTISRFLDEIISTEVLLPFLHRLSFVFSVSPFLSSSLIALSSQPFIYIQLGSRLFLSLFRSSLLWEQINLLLLRRRRELTSQSSSSSQLLLFDRCNSTYLPFYFL